MNSPFWPNSTVLLPVPTLNHSLFLLVPNLTKNPSYGPVYVYMINQLCFYPVIDMSVSMMSASKQYNVKFTRKLGLENAYYYVQ